MKTLLLLAAFALLLTAAHADTFTIGVPDNSSTDGPVTQKSRQKGQVDHTAQTGTKRTGTVRSMTKKITGDTNSASSFAEATAPKNGSKSKKNEKSAITDGSHTHFDPKTKTWVNVPAKKTGNANSPAPAPAPASSSAPPAFSPADSNRAYKQSTLQNGSSGATNPIRDTLTP